MPASIAFADGVYREPFSSLRQLAISDLADSRVVSR